MLENHVCTKARQRAESSLSYYHEYIKIVLTPFHSSFSSSIRGSKNTSKSFTREVGPRINRDIKQFNGFTHFHGGRFRGVTRTGHILYVELKLPNGLKPSMVTTSLKFLGSSAKVGCFLLKSYHASSSAGWLI